MVLYVLSVLLVQAGIEYPAEICAPKPEVDPLTPPAGTDED